MDNVRTCIIIVCVCVCDYMLVRYRYIRVHGIYYGVAETRRRLQQAVSRARPAHNVPNWNFEHMKDIPRDE